MRPLRDEVLELLREWRDEYGNCYHSLSRIFKELKCEEADLFNWDYDRGPLLDLEDEGLVNRIDDNFIAMHDDW